MSDRFNDTRVYRKRSTDSTKIEATKAFNRINGLYANYAKAVNVTKIDDNFKRIVDDFKACFEYPSSARPTGLIKTQWIDYYKTYH